MSFSLNIPKPFTINVNVTGATDPAVLAAIAALEKKVADTAAELIAKFKEAADKIAASTDEAASRIATDVTELKRVIAEGGLTPEATAAANAALASLDATGGKLAGLDPLPEFPPAEPTA